MIKIPYFFLIYFGLLMPMAFSQSEDMEEVQEEQSEYYYQLDPFQPHLPLTINQEPHGLYMRDLLLERPPGEEKKPAREVVPVKKTKRIVEKESVIDLPSTMIRGRLLKPSMEFIPGNYMVDGDVSTQRRKMHLQKSESQQAH